MCFNGLEHARTSKSRTFGNSWTQLGRKILGLPGASPEQEALRLEPAVSAVTAQRQNVSNWNQTVADTVWHQKTFRVIAIVPFMYPDLKILKWPQRENIYRIEVAPIVFKRTKSVFG